MKKILVCIVTISSLSGCSTMFNSGSQMITALPPSNQKNVEVIAHSTNGSFNTTLPTVITAESSYEPVSISVVDKCYAPTSVQVNKHITPSFWTNIFSPVGFVVDLITGRYWKYDSTLTIPLQHIPNCTKLKNPAS